MIDIRKELSNIEGQLKAVEECLENLKFEYVLAVSISNKIENIKESIRKIYVELPETKSKLVPFGDKRLREALDNDY